MKALTVTASILLAVLLLGIGWLAFFPGDAGRPRGHRGGFAAAAKAAGTAALRFSRQLQGHRSICRRVSASLR